MDKSLNVDAAITMIDNDKQTNLLSNGYTILPFLNTNAVKKLEDYYYHFQKQEPDHFYSSTHSSDKNFRKETSDFIKTIVAPFMDSHFQSYKLLGGAFVAKPANGKGLLPPHQDWNLVNEAEARSYNIWIPLTDVSFTNGAMCVLKSSHTRMPTYRGPGIPSIFKDIEPLVWQHLQVLDMTAGNALIYDHALLHASPVNTTNKVRLGIVCGLIGVQSNMQLYFNTPDAIKAYKIDENFFFNSDPAEGPHDLTFITNAPGQNTLDKKDFMNNYINYNNKTWWLKKLFKYA